MIQNQVNQSKIIFSLLLTIFFPKNSIDEVLISVRGLGSCKDIKLIEFARIILVDELTANKTLYKDYEPMKNRPSYDSIDDPNKIVS